MSDLFYQVQSRKALRDLLFVFGFNTLRFWLTTIKSVAFLFLLERWILGAASWVRISKVLYMISITVSSGGPLSASLVRWFLNIYHVPISQKDLLSLKILKKDFISGIISFCGYYACSSGFVYFGSSML